MTDRNWLGDLQGVRLIDGDTAQEMPQRKRLVIRNHSGGLADNAVTGETELDLSGVGGTGGGGGGGPVALTGDVVGQSNNNEVVAYHLGATKVTLGSQAVGELLERTASGTAGGSRSWIKGTSAPGGTVSANDGAIYQRTDTRELFVNIGGGTTWERCWPLQIVNGTGESDVPMTPRPRVRLLGDITLVDNGTLGSTDITFTAGTGGGGGGGPSGPGSGLLFAFDGESTSMESAPDTGQFRVNDGEDPWGITEIGISQVDLDEDDATGLLWLPLPSVLSIRSPDYSVHHLFIVTELNSGSWTTFGVQPIHIHGELTDEQAYAVDLYTVPSTETSTTRTAAHTSVDNSGSPHEINFSVYVGDFATTRFFDVWFSFGYDATWSWAKFVVAVTGSEAQARSVSEDDDFEYVVDIDAGNLTVQVTHASAEFVGGHIAISAIHG